MICRTLPRPTYQLAAFAARCTHSGTSAALYNHKYIEKLQLRAQEKGLALEELKLQAREEARCKQQQETASLLASFKKVDSEPQHTRTRTLPLEATGTSSARKDSSPVKPLSSILNLPKVMATPHTSSQISALWTAYHASRSRGTGRGYICASLPLDSYNAMAHVARKHPVFVVPMPRETATDSTACRSTDTAQEFFYLQWDFHPAPPAPSPMESNPFKPVTLATSSHIPEPSTVLFTPLQEYKLRASFATPYLVLTFYTDLSQSHGIVLLHGEITPSSVLAAARPEQEPLGRYLLAQADAHLLAMSLQRFYLWKEVSKDGSNEVTAETLLKQFHEEPEKFSWQDLIRFSNVVA